VRVRLALVLGVLHAFVDAATVTVLFRATSVHGLGPGTVFVAVLGYDLVAFGLQPLLGWAQDRWATPRTAMVAGLGFTLGSIVVLEAVSLIGRLTAGAVSPTTAGSAAAVVLAGLGNALFHLGAGAQVLRQGLARAAPVGLLVAPGVLGLALGVWFGKQPSAGSAWLIGLPVLVAVGVVVALRVPQSSPSVVSAGDGPLLGESQGLRARRRVGTGSGLSVTSFGCGALALLMTSIAVRSLVGGSASRGYHGGGWLLVGIPLVAFAGKALGGILADRFGWVRTTVSALLASAPLLAFTYPHPTMLLAGLLVFQMTMPVTLVAIVRLMPDRLATGFGLTCLALIMGGLPIMFPWGAALGAKPMIGLWIVISAVAAWGGLRLIGLTWRRRPELVVGRASRLPDGPAQA